MQKSSIVKWERRIRISTAVIFAILMMLNIYISEKFKTDFVFSNFANIYFVVFKWRLTCYNLLVKHPTNIYE